MDASKQATAEEATMSEGTKSTGKRLRIFEVSPEDAPQPAYDEVVGRFRSGMQDAEGNPRSLDAWRITTGDPVVAAAVAEAYGGEPEAWDTKGEEVIQVLTEAQVVPIVVSDADAIKASMVLMSSDFKKLRECDGMEQTEEFGCEGCVCPPTLKERKAAARKGTGCKPSVGVYFTLAELPELGRFRYYSGAWGLLEAVPGVQEQLDAVGGPASVDLGLKRVSFTNSQGVDVSYSLAQLKVKGAADV